jgi:hypothetical protein
MALMPQRYGKSRYFYQANSIKINVLKLKSLPLQDFDYL